MRFLRAVSIAALAVGALVVPSSASAQIDSLSVSSPAQLTADRSMVVTLTYVCDPGWNVAFGDATVRQITGFKQAVGSGFLSNPFPGVPCTGTSQSSDIIATSFSSFAFKPGKATVTAGLTVFNPTTFNFASDASDPVEIHVRR